MASSNVSELSAAPRWRFLGSGLRAYGKDFSCRFRAWPLELGGTALTIRRGATHVAVEYHRCNMPNSEGATIVCASLLSVC
jgi:hypothetical protein